MTTTTIKCRRRQRCLFSSVLLSVLVTVNHVDAFLVTPSFRRIGWNLPNSWSSSASSSFRTIPTRHAFFVSPFCFSLHAASTSNSAKSPDTDRLIDSSQDPFQVLGIDATADAKVIQRAYKRRALQYHPDVVTTKDSSKEEKKVASDRFAKINWAYMTLTGKGGGGGTGSTSTRASSSSTSSSTSSSSSWTPPHRRPASSSASSSYYSSSSSSSTNNQQPPPQQQPSTDWRDYMPKYEDDEWYDANGDSLGAIFSDIILGVATGGRGLVKDFVEFLEKADGFGVSGYDGSGSGSGSTTSFGDLDPLFHSNSITDVGNEMDDTELMVQQLSTKLQNTQNDIIDYQAQLQLSNSYVERLQLQEQLAEAQARQKVVQDYLKTARKRLLALQTKYKELLIKQPPPPPPPRPSTTTSSSSRRSTTSTPPPPSSSSSSSSSTRPGTDSSRTASTTSTSASSTSGENESWKRESFGSFGRGRSSGSSRARRPSSSTSSRDAPPASSGASSTSATPPPPPSSSSYSSARGSTSSSASSTSSTIVPPHRRTAANDGSTSWREEQQRLRDLQVEEEFQKLKNQLSAGGVGAGSKSSAPYKPSRQQQVEEEFDKLRKELGM